jgi:adenylate cyclase
VSSIITQHSGIIDKYMGDSVMAFWDSQSCPHHAQKAVNAAIAIELYFTKDYAGSAKASEPLEYGIGINSGVAMVGQMGTTERASYTVMGDVINVASRLQTLSSTMGCHIILGSETVEQLEGIAYRSLGEVKLRGRQNTVLIHTPTIPIVSLN